MFFRFAAQDPSFTGKGAKAVFRDKEGVHHVYAYHVLVILVAVNYVYIPVFCGNILSCFTGKRINQEDIQKAKGDEKPKVDICSFSGFVVFKKILSG